MNGKRWLATQNLTIGRDLGRCKKDISRSRIMVTRCGSEILKSKIYKVKFIIFKAVSYGSFFYCPILDLFEIKIYAKVRSKF